MIGMSTARRIPLAALCLGLSLAACAGDGGGNETDPGEGDFLAGSPGGHKTALPSDDATAVSPSPSPEQPVGGDDRNTAALEAIATAEDHAGGSPYSIDGSDGNTSWEVEVAVGDRTVEVEVDQAGEVVETEDDDLGSADRQALDGAQVGLAEAVESALAEADGALQDVELDEEDDRYYWAVTVDVGGDDVDYRVDLVSGEVTRDDG
jgi:uncharacterized membrane protein YkoI